MAQSLKLFRKHQRVLMVITTGLAMISFVLLGSTGSASPNEMPTVLVVLALAAMLGGAAWVLGLLTKKPSEYGMVGAAAGAVLGVAVSWSSNTTTAVFANSGNISVRQLDSLRHNRSVANQFVRMAFQTVNGFDPVAFGPQIARRYLFGFAGGDGESDGDLVITELLRREADRLGIVVPEDAVFDFVKSLAFVPDKSLTEPQFAEIRGRLGVSEAQLLHALQEELKAKRAAETLYSQSRVPPESLWEYFRKLNTTQEAELAVLPIEDFLDPAAQPPADELQKLFAEYRESDPGVTKQGRIEEGRPGFRQPPRFKLAYLEAVYDDFEKKVPEVTDAEIEARYEEAYKKGLTAPDLPATSEDPFPAGETPASDAAPLKTPDLPAPASDAPAEPPAAEPETTSEARPEPPPTAEESTPESSDAQPEESAAPEAEVSEPQSSNLRSQNSALSFVAFQDEAAAEETPAQEQPAEEPKAEEPKAEEPKAEEPKAEEAAATGEAPAAAPADADKPADTPAEQPVQDEAAPPAIPAPPGDTSAAAESPADPPIPTIRPLDDALRGEIRDELLRERTSELLEQAAQKAAAFMTDEIGLGLSTPKEDPEHLTREAATEKLKEFARNEGLVYVETPWLSYSELQNSVEYPLGGALVMTGQQPVSVADDVARSYGRSQKFMARRASSFATSSEFAYWITDERPAFVPENMDEQFVKDQVIKAWRERQALAKARERAEQLTKIVRESDKPMGEALSAETISGKPGTGYVTVRPTGKFSWYQLPSVAPRGLQQEPPRLTEIPGLAALGEEFMRKVFDDLKPGEAGIAESAEKSEVYVVKVLSRTPSTPEEMETFRNRFLAQGMNPAYAALAQRDMIYHGRNGIDELWDRHEVKIVEREAEQEQP